MGPKNSLTCSQNTITDPYPKPYKSIPQLPTLFP